MIQFILSKEEKIEIRRRKIMKMIDKSNSVSSIDKIYCKIVSLHKKFGSYSMPVVKELQKYFQTKRLKLKRWK